MKFLIFTICISLTAIVNAKPTDPGRDPHEGVGTLPTLNIPSLNFQGNGLSSTLSFSENYFEKKIVQRPKVMVNEYLGDLTTSINIPLPKSFHSVRGLVLNYNSSQNINYGYGIGMSLNLPKVLIDNNADELKIINTDYAGELIKKGNLDAMATKRIEKICQVLSIKCDASRKDFFLNQSGEDSSLYLRMISGSVIKYAQIKTNGETWLFDNEGFPERVFTAKQRGLKVTYEDGVLRRLEDLDSLWQAELSYVENSNEIRSYNGNFRSSLVGLKEISVSQGSSEIDYKFEYSGEYLVRAFEHNSLKILFQGEYDYPKNNSFELVQETSPINYQKKSTLMYEADLKKLSWVAENSENVEFFVDLNGDFYQDKVVLNQKEINDVAKNIIKDYPPEKHGRSYRPKREPTELASRLNSIDQKVLVFIASNENGKIVYKEDRSLSLPVNEVKFLNFTVTPKDRVEETEGGSVNVTEYWIEAKFKLTPKFIDMDNNGKKDILFCDYIEELKSLSRDLVGGSFSGQKQNPVSTLYFDFYKNGSFASGALSGRIQSQYMIYPDRNKLQAFIAQNPGSSIQFPPNTSLLKKIIPSQNAICNQVSIPIDYNKDGVVDFLTGNQVTLFNALGATKNIVLTNDEVKRVINPPRGDLAFDSNMVDLIDVKNNNTLDFVSTFASYVDHKDRSLVYLRDSVAYKVKRKSPVKLLVKESVTFGGSALIDYKYVDGSSLVESITFNPVSKKSEKNRKQPVFKKTYEYTGSKFHDQFNILLGHQVSQERNELENTTTSIKVTEFDRDFQNGPVFYLTRARKNGRVLKRTVYDGNSQWTSKVKNTYGEATSLGQDRVFSFLKNKEEQVTGLGSRPLVEQYSYLRPLSNIAFLETNEKSISSSNEIVAKNEFIFDSANYQLLHSLQQVLDQNDNRLKTDNLKKYNSDAEMISELSDGITKSYSYDNYGRLASLYDERGKGQVFSYYKSSPLLSSSKEDQSDIQYDYFDVTNFLKSYKKDNESRVSYKWSNDEVLTSIERKGVSLYQLQYNSDHNLFQINIDDFERLYYLDGFGRVVKIDRVAEDGLVSEKHVTLNEADQVIREKVPGSENASIETRYDSLGRQVYNELSGKFRLEGAGFSFKKISKFEENGKYQVWEDLAEGKKDYKKYSYNERGHLLNLKSLSEDINFSINPMGLITEVKELGAKFSYDLTQNLTSTEASSTDGSWALMNQKYAVLENKLTTISGTIQKDKEGQEIRNDNSSSYSSMSIKNAYFRGMVQESAKLLNGFEQNESYHYNAEGELVKIAIGELTKKFEYDNYSRTSKETLTFRNSQTSIESFYSKGSLDSLSPFINKIIYNERSLVSEVIYENGVRASFEYDVFGKPIYLNWNVGGGNFGMDYNTNLGFGEQTKLYSNVEYTGLAQKNKIFEYDNINYLKKKPRLSLQSSDVKFQNGNIIQSGNTQFGYENDLLTKIIYKKTNFHNFISADQKWLGTCPEKYKSLNDCFLKISPSEFLVLGEYVKSISVAGKMLGVLYKEKFYPAIVDHLGSVLALVDPEGDKLVFERIYNEWGEKEKVVGDKDFEKMIPWAYAGLIQHPFMNGEILQSETRVYIPSLGGWSSVDPLVKWNPSDLLDRPGNWKPLQYAGGDPVNHFDQSGRSFVAVAAVAAASTFTYMFYKVYDFIKTAEEGYKAREESDKKIDSTIKNKEMASLTKLHNDKIIVNKTVQKLSTKANAVGKAYYETIPKMMNLPTTNEKAIRDLGKAAVKTIKDYNDNAVKEKISEKKN